MSQSRMCSLGCLLVITMVSSYGTAQAQKQGGQPTAPAAQAAPAERQRLFGTIESVGVDRLTVKRPDGTSATVVVNEQTRYRMRRQDIHLEDLKPGDHVVVGGRVNPNQEFTAALIRKVSEEDMQRMPGPGEAVFGKIVAIDNNQLRIRTRMQGEKTVLVNAQTEFLKSGQPAGLKDLKVGDRIFARGKESNGQFTATRVVTGQMPGEDGRRRWQEGAERNTDKP